MGDRRIRTAAVGLAVVGAWWLAPAVGAAPTVEDVSWWTRSPLAAAPDGGFVVGTAPDGVTSIAGIRIADARGAVLVSNPTGGTADLARIQVCSTTASWVDASPGALGEAPTPDCSSAVPFAPVEGEWRADVGGLVGDGPAELLVVPVSGSVAFEVSFEAPTVRSPAPAVPAASDPRDAPSAPPSISTDPSPSPSPSPLPAPSAPIAGAPFVAPPIGPIAVAAGDLPADDRPAVDPGDEVEVAEDDALDASEFAVAAPPIEEARGSRVGDALVLVLLSAVVGFLVFAAGRIRDRLRMA